MAEKEFEHDKVVAKLIEVSNSRVHSNESGLAEANKKVEELNASVKDKE